MPSKKEPIFWYDNPTQGVDPQAPTQKVGATMTGLAKGFDVIGDELQHFRVRGDLESGGDDAYVSGQTGWHLTSGGAAEFNDITARGQIRGATFIARESQVIGGELIAKPGGTLYEDVVLELPPPPSEDGGTDPTGSAPNASFTADTTSGDATLAVTFTDTSTSDFTITAWAWTFGDGNTSTSQNPSNSYDTPGVYSVSLTATNAYGSNTATRTDYITVTREDDAEPGGAATAGAVIEYLFNDASGTTVADSGSGAAYDLTIQDSGQVAWGTGYLEITGATVLSNAAACAKLQTDCVAADEVTVEVWCENAQVTSDSENIVTFSADKSTRNVTLRHLTNWAGIVRTADTDNAGDSTDFGEDTASTSKQHVVYTYSDGDSEANCYINSNLMETETVTGDLNNWDASYGLYVGNEPDGKRPWTGKIYVVRIYDFALSAAQVATNYVATGGGTPAPPDPPTPEPPTPDDDDPPTPAGAAFYVDWYEGNDGNVGSEASPWRTIAMANNTLTAGQGVYIRAGTYDEPIEPKNDGTASGGAIIYQPYPGEKVTIRGTGQDQKVCYIKNRKYITIWGLYFTPKDESPGGNSRQHKRWGHITIGNSEHIHIRYCTVYVGGIPWHRVKAGFNDYGIHVTNGCRWIWLDHCDVFGMCMAVRFVYTAEYCYVSSCNLHDTGQSPMVISPYYGDLDYRGIYIYDTKLNWSQYEDACQTHNYPADAGVGHRYAHKQGIIFKSCELSHNTENCFDFKSAVYVLVDDCDINGTEGQVDGGHNEDGPNRHAMGTISRGAKAGDSHTVIIRDCRIYDNPRCRIYDLYRYYHNTFLGNNRDHTGPDSSWKNTGSAPYFTAAYPYNSNVDDHAFVNNVAAGHNEADMTWMDGSQTSRIDYNCYYNSRQVRWCLLDRYLNPTFYTTLGTWQSALGALSGVSGADANSINSDPELRCNTDRPTAEPGDISFEPKPGSPLIDAGTHLALTDGAGTQAIWVTLANTEDAAYFTDGHNCYECDSDGTWTRVYPDTIRIGSTDAVEIVEVDRDNGRIRLAEARTWGDGDAIYWRDYKGTAPDIGAIETDY